MGQKVTVKKVAEEAGCSAGAVSVVLNNAQSNIRVSPATADRIRQTAERLGYVPSYHAQSLHRGNSLTIGLVLGPEAHSLLGMGFWAKFVASVDLACRERGYDLLFIGPSEAGDEVERAILTAQQGRVDGLITAEHSYAKTLRDALLELRHPLVHIRERQETPHPTVLTDERPALQEMVAHLLEKDHKALSYFTAEPEETPFWANRLFTLKEVCKEQGMDLEIVHLPAELDALQNPRPHQVLPEVYKATTQHLKNAANRPTACFYFNDNFAMGGVHAIKDLGLRIPDDVSVAAVDNLRSFFCMPPLSNISMELDEVGRQAVDLVVQMASDPDCMEKLRGHCSVVPMKFIPRESIGAARRSS